MRPVLERRLQPRVQLTTAGKITLDNGTEIECVIVNRSASGVCVEVDDPARVAGQFLLTIGTEDLNRRCSVIWRLGKRLGLTFEVDSADLYPAGH